MPLARLCEAGKIRKVMRGVYDYPRYSKLLEENMAPDLFQVAQALARKFGWRIQPGGTVAQNLIGLSTQVPSQYVFKSDEPARTYEIGNIKLEFKHVALKEADFRRHETGIIVQALKSMGKNRNYLSRPPVGVVFTLPSLRKNFGFAGFYRNFSSPRSLRKILSLKEVCRYQKFMG